MRKLTTAEEPDHHPIQPVPRPELPESPALFRGPCVSAEGRVHAMDCQQKVAVCFPALLKVLPCLSGTEV